MSGSWIQELNPEQRQAATHAGGPLLVIAGAGSGKTKTLAARVACLVERGTPPERILLLTFTRRAAAEMLNRAGRHVGQSASGRVWGGTFHATANRLLRLYGRALGLAPEFTVMDQSDTADLMNLLRTELNLGEGRKRFPQKGTLAAIYSRCVNSRTRAPEVVKRHFPWCQDSLDGMREIFRAYAERKRLRNVLDYDDLLLYWHALCRLPDVGPQVAERFDHILVDEYQDTNIIQSELLKCMRQTNDNLMVVGDDAQAIYSFRAATVRNILDFPEQYPGTTIVRLERNYRSTQPILDASNAVMRHASERHTKELYTDRGGSMLPSLRTCRDEAEQCDAVCETVLLKREEGIALREQAVLFRAGHHSDLLEVELSRRNIPFVKYGGLKFVEAAHVKDMIAILRLVDNPRDELSWYRVLQLLDGIGPAGARKIAAGLLHSSDGEPTPLDRLRDAALPVPASAREEFKAFRTLLLETLTTDERTLPPAGQVERIRRFYEPIFQRVYDNSTTRLRDLDQLEQIAGRYAERTSFLADLTLDPPHSTQDFAGPPLLDEDYLILSTIHSAKGCEWDVVHLIHVADGMIPSDMATGDEIEIEEERRLLYVAMTRARDALCLYFPLRYYDRPRNHGDRHSYAQLTRFIPEADRHHYQLELPLAAAGADPALDPDFDSQAGRAAVDALISDLWE